nr:hypothetical protein FFPRI1PSEUD_33330 [Pseudomonas sp. FFPRI_1]
MGKILKKSDSQLTRRRLKTIRITKEFEYSYEWAETVKDFARVPHLMGLFPQQTLMLGSDATNEVEDITRWEQDKAAKSLR